MARDQSRWSSGFRSSTPDLYDPLSADRVHRRPSSRVNAGEPRTHNSMFGGRRAPPYNQYLPSAPAENLSPHENPSDYDSLSSEGNYPHAPPSSPGESQPPRRLNLNQQLPSVYSKSSDAPSSEGKSQPPQRSNLNQRKPLVYSESSNSPSSQGESHPPQKSDLNHQKPSVSSESSDAPSSQGEFQPPQRSNLNQRKPSVYSESSDAPSSQGESQPPQRSNLNQRKPSVSSESSDAPSSLFEDDSTYYPSSTTDSDEYGSDVFDAEEDEDGDKIFRDAIDDVAASVDERPGSGESGTKDNQGETPVHRDSGLPFCHSDLPGLSGRRKRNVENCIWPDDAAKADASAKAKTKLGEEEKGSPEAKIDQSLKSEMAEEKTKLDETNRESFKAEGSESIEKLPANGAAERPIIQGMVRSRLFPEPYMADQKNANAAAGQQRTRPAPGHPSWLNNGAKIHNIQKVGPMAVERFPQPKLIRDEKLLAIAEKNSKEKFDSLLEQFGHSNVAKHQGQLHAELSTRLEEFKEQPRLERISGMTAKVGGAALAAGGLALYGYAVAEAFSSETSVLDKVAVTTSILPVIGCSVQAANDAQQGNFDILHSGLCFAADALLLSGFWEVALVLQIFEGFFQTLSRIDAQVKLYDASFFQKERLDGWKSRIDEIERFIDSDAFMKNATTRFSAYQVGVLFQASQLAGDVHASHRLAMAQTNDADLEDVQMDQVQKEIDAAIHHEIERRACFETARNKLRVHDMLRAQMLNATRTIAQQYDDEFFKQYWKAATDPIKLIGIISFDPAPEDVKSLKQGMEFQKKFNPLPLFEHRIFKAISRVVERLETPATCLCRHKDQNCEFADCSSPPVEFGSIDAGGRRLVANLVYPHKSLVSEECAARFHPCVKDVKGGGRRATMNISSRQMWCKAGPPV
ncbi:hypothetical protein CDD81_4181 [Ophiocordyceps australis]|uniref:Uncharacterized protein n=1 Tax=Ophiocordyceps australis TaxID=1399860 RepID=A0A2C5XW09_9HYPO|nr:hypothetical protein CDD81_4181 [Ophiocordyceps australis]